MNNPIRMLLISTALLLACRAQPPAPAKPLPVESDPSPRVREETPDSCVDTWLAQKHLDSFGNPPDSNYPGGSPLVDEATGEKIDRFEYLYKRFPELAKLCRKTGK